ncbi:hypothetical protein Tco_0568869 [Tanacetum coccineum]
MERSAGAKTNQTQKDRNPAQAGFRVIPDYKALAISRVGHGYHRKDLSQILKRSYFYPSIVATAQPSPPSALDIAYAVHVVSQFVSASTGPRRGVRRHSLGNSAEDHTGHSDEVVMLARCGGLNGRDEPAVMAAVVRGAPAVAAVEVGQPRWRWCGWIGGEDDDVMV